MDSVAVLFVVVSFCHFSKRCLQGADDWRRRRAERQKAKFEEFLQIESAETEGDSNAVVDSATAVSLLTGRAAELAEEHRIDLGGRTRAQVNRFNTLWNASKQDREYAIPQERCARNLFFSCIKRPNLL